MEAAKYVEGFEVRNRLAELGLDEQMLIEAVQRGHAAWNTCTPNHPPMFPGYLAWAEAVRALREATVLTGWQRCDEGNLPFTVNSTGSVALAVATGDEDTGRMLGSPCTKARKGPMTAKAVAENHGQLSLFENIPLLPEDVERINGRMTWLLLMYRDKELRELRCELSRPINIGEDGRVDGWAERIILASTPFDADEVSVTRGGPSAPQSPEIIVEVKKRA